MFNHIMPASIKIAKGQKFARNRSSLNDAIAVATKTSRANPIIRSKVCLSRYFAALIFVQIHCTIKPPIIANGNSGKLDITGWIHLTPACIAMPRSIETPIIVKWKVRGSIDSEATVAVAIGYLFFLWN